MAFTQYEEPSIAVLPAFNKILFRVLSDNVLQPGFKYAVKIINNQTNTVIATSYYPPSYDPAEPVEIDVSNFLQSYFNYYRGLLYAAVPTWQRTDEISLSFEVEFYEYYDADNDGILEIITASVRESSQFTALPFVFNPYERYFWDYADMFMFPIYKPFTNWKNITLTSNSYFNFLLYEFYLAGINLVQVSQVNARYYDSANNLISTISYPLTTVPNNQFEIGAYFHFNLNNAPAGTSRVNLDLEHLFVGIAWTTVDFAIIKVLNCIRPTGKTLYYLNRFGAYDTFVFPLNSFTYKDLKKEHYKRFINDYGYTNTEGIWRHRNSNPVYHSATSTRMMLQSDWLTDEQSKCLEELFNSSSVYMLDTEGGLNTTFQRNRIFQPPKLIPVNVKDNSYEVKYTRAYKLFQYNVQIEFAEKENRHSL